MSPVSRRITRGSIGSAKNQEEEIVLGWYQERLEESEGGTTLYRRLESILHPGESRQLSKTAHERGHGGTPTKNPHDHGRLSAREGQQINKKAGLADRRENLRKERIIGLKRPRDWENSSLMGG